VIVRGEGRARKRICHAFFFSGMAHSGGERQAKSAGAGLVIGNGRISGGLKSEPIFFRRRGPDMPLNFPFSAALFQKKKGSRFRFLRRLKGAGHRHGEAPRRPLRAFDGAPRLAAWFCFRSEGPSSETEINLPLAEGGPDFFDFHLMRHQPSKPERANISGKRIPREIPCNGW